jgi:hypothetical protein
MRISTLFLSSAALLASATLGQAADLPSKKAAPVDFVKVCNINNAFTGFVIPGTDTCLKVGGFVRYQSTFNEPKWTGVGAGRVNGRTANAVSFAAKASLKLDARQTTEYGLLRSFADIRVDQSGSAAIDKAYIQFGGLHAGLIQSVFDFYADDASYGSAGLGSDHSAVSLGYTAQFGGGLYGVVAVEDATTTRVGGAFAGQRAPDLVAAFGAEQSWGSAKLSAALHQLSDKGGSSNEYGYAVQAGVKILVPALGASDALFLQAAYADGATAYLGKAGPGFGNLAGSTSLADYSIVNSGIKSVTGYNVTAAFEHAFSSTVFGNVFGGYTVYDSNNLCNKAEVVQAGVNLTWIPVKGFKVGAEVSMYSSKFANAPIAGLKKSGDSVQSLIRIQRDF